MKTLLIIFTILTYSSFSQEWKFYNINNSFLEDENKIEDIIVDKNNNVWLINGYKNVFRLYNNEWLKYNKENTVFNTFEFNDIELLEDNSILFGHRGELEEPEFAIYKEDSWSKLDFFNSFLNTLEIKDILYINDLEIWFTTNFGIFRLVDGDFFHYLDNQSQGFNLNSIHRINNFILVFGYAGQCYKLNLNGNSENEISFEKIDFTFPKNVKFGPFFSNNKEYIYVNSTDGKYLMKFDGNSWIEESYNIQDTVQSIYLTREDKVLVLTSEALYEYNNNSCDKLFDIPDSVKNYIGLYRLTLREIDYNDNYYFSKASNLDLIIYSPNKTTVENHKETTNIYPNPTSNSIQINNIKEIQNLQITDLLGKKYIEINNPQNNEIDLSSLAIGIYYLTINHKQTFKIIKK